jgi:hypothetical protein
MRFTFLTIFSIVALFAIGIFSFFQLGSFTNEDVEEYENLIKSTNPQDTDKNLQPYTSTQQHRTTHKDIWFTQGDQRLQLRLRSKDTRLVLEHQDNNVQVVEHMQGVTCYIQEELYYVTKDGRELKLKDNGSYVLRKSDSKDAREIKLTDKISPTPMQVIRYLEADNASYYYQSDRFLAEQVHVIRVAVPGHTLTESLKGLIPLMSGIARSVEFTLADNELNFTAYQLKATLHGSERIK